MCVRGLSIKRARIGSHHPAQGQAGDRDAKLDPVNYVVEILMQAQDRPRADAAGFDQLQNSRFADADQGEFAAAKKAFIATNRKIRNTRSSAT